MEYIQDNPTDQSFFLRIRFLIQLDPFRFLLGNQTFPPIFQIRQLRSYARRGQLDPYDYRQKDPPWLFLQCDVHKNGKNYTQGEANTKDAERFDLAWENEAYEGASIGHEVSFRNAPKRRHREAQSIGLKEVAEQRKETC